MKYLLITNKYTTYGYKHELTECINADDVKYQTKRFEENGSHFVAAYEITGNQLTRNLEWSMKFS